MNGFNGIAPLLSFFCRIVIGMVFSLSGLAKISDPINFFAALGELRIFPDFFIRFFAVYLPWLEFFLGLFLLFGLFYRSAALLIALLNIIFSGAIISLIAREIVIDCGCFGLLADYFEFIDIADHRAVIRNIIFFLLSLFIFFTDKTILSLEDHLKIQK